MTANTVVCLSIHCDLKVAVWLIFQNQVPIPTTDSNRRVASEKLKGCKAIFYLKIVYSLMASWDILLHFEDEAHSFSSDLMEGWGRKHHCRKGKSVCPQIPCSPCKIVVFNCSFQFYTYNLLAVGADIDNFGHDEKKMYYVAGRFLILPRR